MSEVLDCPQGKLVTMEFNAALGRVQSVTGMLMRFRDGARAMGSSDIAEECDLAKDELEQLLSELTFSE